MYASAKIICRRRERAMKCLPSGAGDRQRDHIIIFKIDSM